jgi:hypothetical protein
LISRNATIDRTFENLLPVGHFNYGFSNFKHLCFDYEASIYECDTNGNTNYLQQVTTNNLERYFMLSFIYVLNKQLNPLGGMRSQVVEI